MAEVLQAVEVLLEHKADINIRLTDKSTALITAVCHRRVELVKFLLSRGADVNATSLHATPLSVAWGNRDVRIARILLEHGADPTLETNGCKVPQSFLDQLRK